MSNRAWLWVAFVAVHVTVAVLGFVYPNSPMGDVYIVYDPWSTAALNGQGIIGVDSDFVYPQVALVPMILANLLQGIGGYIVAWAIVVSVLDALAFQLLLGSGRSRGRVFAAGFWLAAILLLGPVGMYRIDGVVVPFAIAGLLWLRGRPIVAGLLLTLGTWMKIWPAAILAAAFVALQQRWTILASALVTTLGVVSVLLFAGGAEHVLGFVNGQVGRGIQVEAVVATPYVWGTMFGLPGFSIYYSNDMLTFQVDGTAVDAVVSLMTPLLALVAVGIMVLGFTKLRAGASTVALLPPLTLSLVIALIVFNKVGSPQFQTWLFAPVVFWLVVDRSRAYLPAALVLITAAATQLLYPLVYFEMIRAEFGGVMLMTVRNILYVVLLVVAVSRLAKVPVPAPAPALAVAEARTA